MLLLPVVRLPLYRLPVLPVVTAAGCLAVSAGCHADAAAGCLALTPLQDPQHRGLVAVLGQVQARLALVVHQPVQQVIS